MQDDQLEYVGFWARVGASLIDTVLMSIVSYPLLSSTFSRISSVTMLLPQSGGQVASQSFTDIQMMPNSFMDFIVTWVLPLIVIIAFWKWRQATPGKMLISARIVDARTGDVPSTGQMIGRYVAYFVSAFPFGLGFLWIAFDRRKQGWHDKLANTVVVRPSNRSPEPVRFESR